MLTKFLFVVATTLSATNALGINCRGSGLCISNAGLLSQAQEQIQSLDRNLRFNDKQHITCVKSSAVGDSSLCVFYQNTGRTWTVDRTIDYIQKILDHGCRSCGSVPTGPGNNVAAGQLTANVVLGSRRRGLSMTQQVKRDEIETEVNLESLHPAEQTGTETEVDTHSAISKREAQQVSPPPACRNSKREAEPQSPPPACKNSKREAQPQSPPPACRNSKREAQQASPQPQRSNSAGC